MLTAKVTYVKGMQFVGDVESGHAIVMDADPSDGGQNTGPRPMELLLAGAGGCSGMDVISILKKKRQDVTGFGRSMGRCVLRCITLDKIGASA